MALKIHCYYKFFDAGIFNNCYNGTDFSKKLLFLDMANGPLGFCVQDLITLTIFKNVKSLLPVRQQIFEMVFNG